jgi:hypothetical protein
VFLPYGTARSPLKVTYVVTYARLYSEKQYFMQSTSVALSVSSATATEADDTVLSLLLQQQQQQQLL